MKNAGDVVLKVGSFAAVGLPCLDHLHPGSNLARPIVPPPIFTSSIFPFSNLRTSSGELRCLTSILDEGIGSLLPLRAIRLGGPRDLCRHSNGIYHYARMWS